MSQKSFFFISLFLILTLRLHCQTPASVNLEETGIWEGLYLNIRLNNRLSYYAEHHFRSRNELENVRSFIGRPRQLYNRFGLNISLTDNIEMVLGPALIVNYTPEPGNPQYEPYTIEPRFWSQFVFKSPYVGRVKFVSQFRFEQRWKKNNQINANYDYTNRYRFKFFAYIPLNKKRIEKGTLFLSPSAEIFMQSGKSIAYNPFEDFRTYNGLGYVLNNNITFFAGHMWTIGQKSTGFEYRTSHVFRFNVYIGLDGRKTKDKLPKINLGY